MDVGTTGYSTASYVLSSLLFLFFLFLLLLMCVCTTETWGIDGHQWAFGTPSPTAIVLAPGTTYTLVPQPLSRTHRQNYVESAKTS